MLSHQKLIKLQKAKFVHMILFEVGKDIPGYILLSCLFNVYVEFSSVQLLSHVWFFVTLWTAAHQASLSITNTQS